jgi:hypothetical protein
LFPDRSPHEDPPGPGRPHAGRSTHAARWNEEMSIRHPLLHSAFFRILLFFARHFSCAPAPGTDAGPLPVAARTGALNGIAAGLPSLAAADRARQGAFAAAFRTGDRRCCLFHGGPPEDNVRRMNEELRKREQESQNILIS